MQEIKEHAKLQSLLDVLQVGGEKKKFEWMSSRITRLWPTWLEAQKNLNKKVDLQSYEKKKVCIAVMIILIIKNFLNHLNCPRVKTILNEFNATSCHDHQK